MNSEAVALPADVLARLRALQLRTRHPANGDGVGRHLSRSRGTGLEFSQYRAYEPGDDPRRIDWKLQARSDRYFVRESERDSPLTVWLLIDGSGSMQQAGPTDLSTPSRTASKFDAARQLAACVTRMAVQHGDLFGLLLLGGDASLMLPATSGLRQRNRYLHELAQRQCQGAFPDTDGLRQFWDRIRPGSLVLLLSDFFDEGVIALAERLAMARRDVVALQLLTSEERDFPFSGTHRFVDIESGSERLVDAGPARSAFLRDFAAAQRTLQQRFRRAGIRQDVHVTDQPIDAPLRRLFASPAGTS